MSEVVNSHVLQPGTRVNATPGLLEVGDVGARQPAGDDPGIVVFAGKAGQDGACLGSERDVPSARLGVAQLDVIVLDVTAFSGRP